MNVDIGRLGDFVEKNYKAIIIAWLVVFLVSAFYASHLFGLVSYNITGSSQNSSGNSVQVAVVVSNNIYSNSTKSFFENVSDNFSYGNITSVYSIEFRILNSTYDSVSNAARLYLNSTYAAYNLTPETVPAALNSSIVYGIALKIQKSLNSSGLYLRNNSLVFIYDIIKDYSNATPSYVINEYGFSRYPVAPNQSTLATIVNRNHNTTIAIINNSNYSFVNSRFNALSNVYGVDSYLTGSSALSSNIETETSTGTTMAILIGIIMVVIVTGLIFKSPVAAFVPLVIFGIDLTIAFGIFYIIYNSILHTTISFFDPALTAILMLGISTDYLVYMLYRFKQELRSDHRKSMKISVSGAGSAIAVSGTTVVLAYVILSMFNFPFLGSTGILNSIGVLIVLVSAVTLMPATLVLFGKKIFYPNINGGGGVEKTFDRIARLDYNNRYLIVVIFSAIVLLSAYLFVTYKPGLNFLGLLPGSQAKQAFYVASENFGFDPLSPITINSSSTAHVNNTKLMAEVNSTHILDGIDSINGVAFSTLSKSNGSFVIETYLKSMGFTTSATDTYSAINSYLSSENLEYNISGLQVFLGNTANSMNNSTPLLISVLGVMIFSVLIILLLSLYTPLRLVLLIVSNLTIANAATIMIFHYLFSLPFISIAQIFLISTIMGVGVDYDIFLVMRVREYVKEGKSSFEAVSKGLAKSGPVIVAIGAIFSIVFLSLIATGVPVIAEIGFIVAVAIIVDSIISILFIVPSIMFILQRYNWWPGPKRYVGARKSKKV